MPEEKDKVIQPKTEDPIDKLLKRVDSGESFAYLKDQNVSLPGYSTSDEMNKFGQSKHDQPLTEQYFQNQVGDKQKPFEYQRAAEQSNWDKAANGTIRLAGRALTSGAEGILTPFVGTFSAIKDGKFSSFYDNPVTKALDEIDKGIKEFLPLYNTREAEEAHGIDKLKYANTLFGDIFDGIGYSIGAIASGGAYTKVASALAKTAIAGKTSDFLGKISSIEGAADKLKYIEQVNKTYKVTDGLKNGTIAFVGATAESSANARADKNEFKEKMTKEIETQGFPITDSQKEYIDMLSEKVGNNSFMLNIPTIMLDNWITFGKAVFGNKLTDKGNLLGIGSKLEAKALGDYSVSKGSLIGDILDKTYGLRQAVKPFVVEGTQEQLQYAISKGTNDFYRKRYYNPESADFIESMAKGLSEAYGTAEGWDNFLIGAMSGGIFGNAVNLKSSGLESYQNPDEKLTAQGLSTLNSISSKKTYKTLIESAMTHANILEEQTKALEKGDDFEYENTKNDMFHNYVSTRLKTGKLEDLYSDLNEFKSMSPEDIKSNFGLELGTDELTGMKQSVSGFVNNKIKQAQTIERAYNIISERFPNVSEGVKDRLAYAAISIDNAKDRRSKLASEVSKIISDNQHSILNPTELSSLSSNYLSLTEDAAKDLYIENLKNSSVSPMDQDEIIKKIKDIDKLTKREKDFVEEYKELSEPQVQEETAIKDSKVEKEIEGAINDANEDLDEEDSDITGDVDETGFDVNIEDAIKGLADQEKLEEKTKLESKKNEDLSKAITPEDKKVIEDKFKKDNEILDKKYAAPLDDIDAISNSITKVNNKNTVDTTPIDKLANKISTEFTPDGKSVAATSNILMIKSFEGSVGITGNFNWKRDQDGLVIPTNTSVTLDINKPEFIKEGDKLIFKITKLDEESQKRNQTAIEYSKKEIATTITDGNPFKYTEEDKNFSTPEYTETIGAFTEDGTLVGYVQIPHWINVSKNLKKDSQGIDPILYEEARKRVIAERKLILDKLSKGEEVSTTVKVKGSGNPLTRLNKDNTPYTSGNLISEVREQDKFNGKPVFVYDNGTNFVLPGGIELQDEYKSFVASLPSFGQRGKLFQVVKTANGKNGLIPVYTNTFNDQNIEKIIEAFNTLSDAPKFNEIIQALNPYVFVGNKDTATIRVSGDGANTTFSIANEVFSLQDLKSNPYRQGILANLLKSKFHNIDANRINSAPYQKYLEATDVLTTNAYTVEGEYFVQPLIEYKSLLPDSLKTKEYTDAKKEVSDSIINSPDSDLDKKYNEAKKKNRDKGIINDDIIDDGSFSRLKQIDSLDRVKVQKFLDKYLPQLTLSDITEVSKVSGSMIDAVGMYRNSVIYLFDGASTKTGYHEAFHGVFRNILSPEEQMLVLNEARKRYPKASREQLDRMLDELTYVKNSIGDTITQEEADMFAEDKYLQEKMSDEFGEFADTQIEKGIGQKILDFFKRILQWFNIISKTSRGEIDVLFNNILAKKYAYHKPVIANQDISHLNEPSFSRPTIGRLSVVTKNERVKSLSSDFIKRYSDLLNTGASINTNDIFKAIYKEYKRIYLEESDKTKPNTNKINVLGEILDHFEEFTQEVNNVVKTTLKIKAKDFKIVDIQHELENDTDPEIEMEGNTTKGYGELTNKAGITSSSLRLKILFSTIPIVNKKGTPILDKYGFPQYYSYERIYYWLERHLIGINDFSEMIEQIKKASVFRPELGNVVEMLTAKLDTRSDELLKKLQNDFRSNFSKQQMLYELVLFNKTKTGIDFKLLNSNREGIAQEIFYQWINNMQIPGADTITDFSKEEIKTNGTKKAIALYTKYKELEPSITSKQIEKILPKVGIEFSEGVIEKVLESNPAEFKKNINNILKYYADNTKDITIEKEGRKSISELVGYELASNLNNYSSSINNVENKAVYTIQNPSWVSKTVSKLTGKESGFEALLDTLKKDPLLKHSNLLKELEQDPSYRSKFKILYLNGLRNSKGEGLGSKFTSMASEDWMATQIALFQNNSSSQNITSTNTVLYTNITPADKTLEIIWEGKKYPALLDADGNILSSSHVIEQFYNVLLGEAERIKQALKDKESLTNDEFIQYYHFSGDKLRLDSDKKPILDGSAYKFNMINGIEGDLYDTIIKELSKDEDVKKALSSIKNKLKAFIAENLSKSYKKVIEESIDKGLISVIEEDGNKFFKSNTIQTSKTSTKDIHEEIRTLLAEFSTNTYLANIEYSNLINGDPAFYKSKDGKVTDSPKRFYQGQSSTISINDKDLSEISVAVISDLETSTEQESLDVLFKHAKGVSASYDKDDSINVTDAQVYVTPELYKSLKEARGIWTAEDELAHQIAEGEVEYTKDAQARLNAIKPFIYGTIYNDKLKTNTPIQIKCSIMPLYKSLISNNPLLQEHRERMIKDKVGMLATESSMKAFLPQRDQINFSGESYKSIVKISGDMFGFQVDNPDHMVDEDNSSMRQIKMLLPGNINPLETYIDKLGSDIIEEISNLESDNINESLEELNTRTKSKDFNEDLSEILTSRKATINTQKILTVDESGNFSYPLDSINTTASENMIASVFTKRVIKQEFKGGSAVQASAAGFKFNTKYKNLLEQQEGLTLEALKVQSSLKWIRAKDANSIDYIECAMPAWTKEFFGTDGKLVDINSLPDSIKTMITYRIPTEGYHSMMSIKVVAFLPAEVGNFMILPYEVTKQFGADFDFDKTYFIYKDFYKDRDGKFKVVKYIDGTGKSSVEKRYKNYVNKNVSQKKYRDLYKDIITEFEKYYDEPIESLSKNEKIQALTEEGKLLSLEEFSELSISRQNTKEARNNRIIDNYDKVLRSYNTLQYLAKPSGFDELSKLGNEILDVTELSNFYEGDTQRYYKDLFHAIIGLKGSSAKHVTGHSYFNMLNLTVGDKLKIRFNNKEYNNLSRLKSDNDNLISEELSTMMAAILDAVKNPDLLPSLGINDKTLGIWATLVHYGVGIKDAALFTSQPVIKDLSKVLKQNEKKIKEIGYKFKDSSDIKSKYILELDSLLKQLPEDFQAKFEEEGYGYKGVSRGYSALTTKELLDYRLYKNNIKDSNPITKEHAYYLAYQIRVLEAYNKLEPVSSAIDKLIKFLNVNKEVGPNFEDIIEKESLYNDIRAYEFPIDGFFKEKIPQLNSSFQAHIDTKDYLSKYIPYASELYLDVKNTVGLYQYKNDNSTPMLKMDVKKRMLVNGFIKMFMDHTFPEFEKINSMAERKRIFKEIPSKLADIKKSSNDEKFFNGALRKNAFIDQLKVTFESGLGYITLKGNRLSDVEKNNIIEAGLALYNHPETKSLFEDLIKYSYLATGFYTGYNSYHSLIPVEAFDTYGANDESESYMNVRRMAQESIDSIKPFDHTTKDLLIDQLVRNFPKEFTLSYEQDLFSGFETNGKPETIYAIENKAKALVIRYDEEIDMNSQEVRQVPIYKKYIRVYSNKYQGSLLYKNTSGSEFKLISYLGKKGFMIEVNASEPIEVSAVDKNNYVHATEAESKPVKNPFASTKPDEVIDDNIPSEEGVPVEDNMSLFGEEETQSPVLEQDQDTSTETSTPKVGFLRKTSEQDESKFEEDLKKLPPQDKC